MVPSYADDPGMAGTLVKGGFMSEEFFYLSFSIGILACHELLLTVSKDSFIYFLGFRTSDTLAAGDAEESKISDLDNSA